MDEDEAEEVARQVSEETGLDDRPRCDPRVIAAGYLDLELLPWPNTPPRLVEGVIWYPSNAPRDAQAYFIAHECGHELVRTERLEGAQLERVCSRIGCALLLPRRAFLRDVRALGADLDQLHGLWPLASRWVIARRLEELGLYRATRDRRGQISMARIHHTSAMTCSPVSTTSRSSAMADASKSPTVSGPSRRRRRTSASRRRVIASAIP